MPVDTAMVHASVSLKPALDAVGQAIDQRFDRLLAVPDDPRRQLFEAMRHAAIGGGKRMRPLLVVAACDLYHVDRERALRVALAIECIHCYSLVHDDLPCMDDDDVRRGKLTVPRACRGATAVLAGDAQHALALAQLSSEQQPEDSVLRISTQAARSLARGAKRHQGR